MANRKVDRPDGELLATLKASGMTHKNIADKYGLSIGTVTGAIRHWQKSNPNAQKFNVVDFGKPLQLIGNFMIVADIHFPTTKYAFAKLVLVVAKHYGIKRIILAGDIFNMDFVSKYQFIVPAITWAQERDAARVLISEWVEYFDEIIFLMGNHDRRMQKFTNGAFDETDVFGLLTTSPKAIFSNFGYCFVKSNDTNWLVTHGSNYSVNQLNVADSLAQKYQMNVISHHEHHFSMGWDRYKHFIVVNNGGLFDDDQMAYTKMDTNKMPNMANGFCMLRNGNVKLFSNDPRFTDWSNIL